MINVEVEKAGSENNLNLLKRFTKKVQGSGILPRVRGLRFYERNKSQATKKKRALKGLKNRETLQKLIKLGKAPVKAVRGRR